MSKMQATVFLACMISTCIITGLGHTTRSLYTAYICESQGIAQSAFNAAYSIVVVPIMFINLNLARIKRSVGGSRNMLLIGLSLILCGNVVTLLGQKLWHFYLACFLTQEGYNLSTVLTMTGLTNEWFPEKEGTVLGVILAGDSVGGALFSVVTGRLLAAMTWRRALMISDLIVAFAITAVILLMNGKKNNPAQADIPHESELKNKKAAEDRSFLKEPGFYLAGLSMSLLPISLQGVTITAPAIMLQADHGPALAGVINGIMFLTAAAGDVLIGWTNDRIGVPKTRWIYILCSAAGVLTLIRAESTVMLLFYGVLFGVGQSLGMMYLPIHVSYMYPGRDSASIMGIWSAFFVAGNIVGNPLISLYFEKNGSYTGILIICAASLVLAGILASFAKPSKNSAGAEKTEI